MTLTPQNERRKRELERKEIERLAKQSKKGNRMADIIANAKYGIGDYIPGFDDGEEPKH